MVHFRSSSFGSSLRLGPFHTPGVTIPPVYEWIHATSHENFKQIKDDGYLKGNYCVDDFFDGKLPNAGAPRGSWFNANNYCGGPIDLTPYPEPNNDETVVALAFPVSKLLDPKEKYQLFNVSRIPCRYLQVRLFWKSLFVEFEYHMVEQISKESASLVLSGM